jgi:hypothetical protein
MQHATPGHVTSGEQDKGMGLLRWDWIVEMEPNDQPFSWMQACLSCLGICDLARNLEWVLLGRCLAMVKPALYP